MAESKIKDDNYYQVTGWMLNKLKLKGTPLNVFAIIYGFSQDGESEFSGSRQYLVDFTNSSKPTVDKALNELCNLNYIIKTSKVTNNITFNSYKANLPLVRELCWGGKETLPPSKGTCSGGGKETLPNNKSLNNKNNNNTNNKERKIVSNSFDLLIEKYATSDDGESWKYPDAPERVELLKEWLKVRKAKRAAMTDRAIELNLNKLDRLASESQMSVVDYLKEVICRGWQAFFVIKDYNTPTNEKNDNHIFKGKRISDLTQQEYEEYLRTQKQGKGNKPIYNWLESNRQYSDDELNGLFNNLDEIQI